MIFYQEGPLGDALHTQARTSTTFDRARPTSELEYMIVTLYAERLSIGQNVKRVGWVMTSKSSWGTLIFYQEGPLGGAVGTCPSYILEIWPEPATRGASSCWICWRPRYMYCWPECDIALRDSWYQTRAGALWYSIRRDPWTVPQARAPATFSRFGPELEVYRRAGHDCIDTLICDTAVSSTKQIIIDTKPWLESWLLESSILNLVDL
jgi:hypothetical protein